MVDESFRARLDNFDTRLEKYSKATVKLGSEVRKIVFEEIERVFGLKTSQVPTVQVSYMSGYQRTSTMPDLIRCLVSETYPLDVPKKSESEATDLDFIIMITSIDNKTTEIPHSSEVDEFWKTCLKRMKETVTYKFVIEENPKILEDARKLKEEIVERIEKPWKI